MRQSENIAVSVIIFVSILMGNALFYTQRYPVLFLDDLPDETRQTFGCIDQSANFLMQSFKTAANLKYESEVSPPLKFDWLRIISADASTQLDNLGKCYDELLVLDPDIDDGGVMASNINVIINLYEPIFVGEAVNFSRAIREMVGLENADEPSSPVPMPAVDSSKFVERASAAINALSVEIGMKVVAR